LLCFQKKLSPRIQGQFHEDDVDEEESEEEGEEDDREEEDDDDDDESEEEDEEDESEEEEEEGAGLTFFPRFLSFRGRVSLFSDFRFFVVVFFSLISFSEGRLLSVSVRTL